MRQRAQNSLNETLIRLTFVLNWLYTAIDSLPWGFAGNIWAAAQDILNETLLWFKCMPNWLYTKVDTLSFIRFRSQYISRSTGYFETRHCFGLYEYKTDFVLWLTEFSSLISFWVKCVRRGTGYSEWDIQTLLRFTFMPNRLCDKVDTLSSMRFYSQYMSRSTWYF